MNLARAKTKMQIRNRGMCPKVAIHYPSSRQKYLDIEIVRKNSWSAQPTHFRVSRPFYKFTATSESPTVARRKNLASLASENYGHLPVTKTFGTVTASLDPTCACKLPDHQWLWRAVEPFGKNLPFSHKNSCINCGIYRNSFYILNHVAINPSQSG